MCNLFIICLAFSPDILKWSSNIGASVFCVSGCVHQSGHQTSVRAAWTIAGTRVRIATVHTVKKHSVKDQTSRSTQRSDKSCSSLKESLVQQNLKCSVTSVMIESWSPEVLPGVSELLLWDSFGATSQSPMIKKTQTDKCCRKSVGLYMHTARETSGAVL